MELKEVIGDIADAMVHIDQSGIPWQFRGRTFQPGVGPYGEVPLVRLIAEHLNTLPKFDAAIRTQRTPDLLVPNEWAIEFKIVRPYGDNGEPAQHWSVNMLHPYEGNESSIGDCYKLLEFDCGERKAIAIVVYEHAQPRVDLTPLLKSFDAIVKDVSHFDLSPAVEERRDGLIHPVHQSLRVIAWEVKGRVQAATAH